MATAPPFQYASGPKVQGRPNAAPENQKFVFGDANAIAEELTARRQADADLDIRLSTVEDAAPGGSGIDYANPLTVTSATTLTADKAHLVSGAGYALTLPDAGANAGKRVYVQIDPAATGIYPVGDFAVYRGETLLLQSIGGAWKRVGGNWRPMGAELRSDSSVALANNTIVPIPFATPLKDNTAGLLLSGPGNTLRAARAGFAFVSVTLFTYAEPGGLVEVGIKIGAEVYKCYAIITQGVGLANITKPLAVQAGDVISVQAVSTSPTGAASVGNTIGSGTYFSFTENIQ